MRNPKSLAKTMLIGLALLIIASPAWATFPGKNGKIVFVGNQSGTWQLYTINPDGSGMDQITSLPPTNFELWLPTFSPDGRRILFAHDTAENPCAPGVFPATGCVDLYVINADGSGLTRLTDDGLSWFGKWSPDGASIVFGHISKRTNQVVISTMKVEANPNGTALTSEFWLSFLPTYTPDGKRIVFISQLDGLVSAAWIMNTDGSNQSRLTPAALEAGPSDVSPDGQRILMVSHNNTASPNEILSMNLELRERDLTQLTHTQKAHNNAPIYSPDGRKIVFVSDRFSSNLSLDLFTMNADGSDVARIASGLTLGGCPDGNCVGPSWGPKPKQ
jgi:TolB protein